MKPGTMTTEKKLWHGARWTFGIGILATAQIFVVGNVGFIADRLDNGKGGGFDGLVPFALVALCLGLPALLISLVLAILALRIKHKSNHTYSQY